MFLNKICSSKCSLSSSTHRDHNFISLQGVIHLAIQGIFNEISIIDSNNKNQHQITLAKINLKASKDEKNQ